MLAYSSFAGRNTYDILSLVVMTTTTPWLHHTDMIRID